MSHHLPVRLKYITVQCDGWCVWTLLEITPLYGRGNQIFFPAFLFPSFIPGGIRSYYPSWNDFNRDTAIPRELSLPAATKSIANWTGLWFIENLLLRRNFRSTHTHTHWEFSLGSSWCVRSQVRAVQGSECQWENMYSQKLEKYYKGCSMVV